MGDAHSENVAADPKCGQSKSRVTKYLPLNKDVPARYRIRRLGAVVQAGTKVQCEVDIEPQQP